ncbi:hypothetical protein BD414DRAFT_517395 [Trametes punicea]|nr:hypothetical protein BD414DRAFT_517395 [Trametes punicea]
MIALPPAEEAQKLIPRDNLQPSELLKTTSITSASIRSSLLPLVLVGVDTVPRVLVVFGHVSAVHFTRSFILLVFDRIEVAGRVSASVSVAYKLDDQLPPIARIHAPFSWTFSNETFITNEGSPRITVTATEPGSSYSALSSATLCVAPHPPPELHISVQAQFYDKNPSLSSVLLVSNSPPLYNSRPALRVPPKWSYSIGFQYDTFIAPNSLYYAATQADGSPLPDWVNFNDRAMMTFDGRVVSLVLHASDQEGYSAASLPFDLVVAAHDLSMSMSSLPTINVTADTASLNSAADLSGVLLDGEPVSPSNITSLEIDTLDLESWPGGQPPSDFSSGVLSVTLTSSVNQTLQTFVTIAAVPSFFSTPDLQPILVKPGSSLSFDLIQFFSNHSGLGKQDLDVNLTAAYDPSVVSYLHVMVTLTAYSRITHSTPHASLPLSLSNVDYANQHNKAGGVSNAARTKLLLGLKIAFGIISAFVSIAVAFTFLRRCIYVPDPAVVGEEEVDGQTYDGPKSEHDHGWSEGAAGPSSPSKEQGEGLGAALTRIELHVSPLSPFNLPQSPGVMKKAEFLGTLRTAVQRVIHKYQRVVSGPRRPVISKPTLITTSETRVGGAMARESIEGLPMTTDSPPDLPMSHPTPYAPSGLISLVDSPSSSTDARSAPRRCADLEPPRVVTSPPQAHVADGDHHSVKSLASSFETNSSSRTHQAEAIVQRATRAMSVRSAASAMSYQSVPASQAEAGRPRLVPFTSATHVPVSKLPSSFFSPDPNTAADNGTTGAPKRVASQIAKVFRHAGGAQTVQPVQTEPSADELKTRFEYVRALGDDGRSSGHDAGHSSVARVPRILARVGERFHRVSAAASRRLVSEKALPKFVKVDLDAVPSAAGARVEKRVVQFYGSPGSGNVGEWDVGVYERVSGECVGRVIVEVVERKSG